MRPSVRERIQVFSTLDAQHQDFDVTNQRTLEALRQAEERHFWHRTRNQWIASRLEHLGVRKGQKVLELGCGGGCVTAYLSAKGYEVVGVDGHLGLVQRAAERAPGARFWVHDLAKGASELPERDFAAAGLFDVIEHLEQPEGALQSALEMVPAGGLVVGTVPALMSLWSKVDEQAGHKLRYEQKQLHAMLQRVQGAKVLEVEPFNRTLVPMMWLQRQWVARRGERGAISEANFQVPPAFLNELLATLLRLEALAAERVSLTHLQGASLWFALRKEAAEQTLVPRGGIEPPT